MEGLSPCGTPYLAAPETRSTELHAWQVLCVLSYRRRENHSFAQPKRFAHNGLVEVRVLPAHNSLVGGLSPSSLQCEPMFPGLSGIARNLRAFPQVQMRTCGLCRWLRSR